MSQSDINELNLYRARIKQLRESKTNEFRRVDEATVYLILAAPTEDFFTDFMQASFDNVRSVPKDWPIDPKDWEGQRDYLRPQLDKEIAENVEETKLYDEVLQQLKDVNILMKVAQNKLDDYAKEGPKAPVIIPVPAEPPVVVVEDTISSLFVKLTQKVLKKIGF